jgi:hypothetical protein
MDTTQNTTKEIMNLIESATCIEVKKKLQRLLKSEEVYTCADCGFTYKYNGRTRHLQSKKHIETIKTGVQYKPKTSGFSKRKDELDEETLKNKQEWYRMKYQERKALQKKESASS